MTSDSICMFNFIDSENHDDIEKDTTIFEPEKITIKTKKSTTKTKKSTTKTKKSKTKKSTTKTKKSTQKKKVISYSKCKCGAQIIRGFIKIDIITDEPIFRYICSFSRKARTNCNK